MDASDIELNIFTLNCWGIPLISKDRKDRICAIGKALAVGEFGNFDFVCLQEVWSDNDYLKIKDLVKAMLPYSHYFYSGVLGSGLCIFSKFPILDVFFHQWSVNGYMHKVQHGDWFGGKGVGLCRINVNGLAVNLYTAHLHAEYNHTDDEYLAHRVLQAFDTAQFIRLTSSDCDLAILGGDLNTEPEDLSYKIICLNAQLEDAFKHNPPIQGTGVGTNETIQNSYSKAELVKQNERGKRIDYVLYKVGRNVKVHNGSYLLPLPFRVPGRTFSFSDHEAVSAKLTIGKISNEESKVQSDDGHLSALEEGMEVCDQALCKLSRDQRTYWLVSAGLFMLFLTVLGTNAPYDLHKTYNIILSVLFALMCFTIFMGTLWNRMEVNGILSGRAAMMLVIERLVASSEEKGEI